MAASGQVAKALICGRWFGTVIDSPVSASGCPIHTDQW